MRALVAVIALAGLVVTGCSDDDGGQVATATTVAPSATGAPVTSCEDYQGDALTDPCAPLTGGPAPLVPAACTSESFQAAVAGEIDGGLRVADAACDDGHLILDFFVDACPPSDGEPVPDGCRRTKRAYFLRDGERWALVTYGDRMTCDEVRARTSKEFPAALCAELLEASGP